MLQLRREWYLGEMVGREKKKEKIFRIEHSSMSRDVYLLEYIKKKIPPPIIELLVQMNESLLYGVRRKSGQLNFFNLKKQNIALLWLKKSFGELSYFRILNENVLIPKIIFS